MYEEQSQNEKENHQLCWVWGGIGQPRFYEGGEKTGWAGSSMLTRHRRSSEIEGENLHKIVWNNGLKDVFVGLPDEIQDTPLKWIWDKQQCVSINVPHAIFGTYTNTVFVEIQVGLGIL